MTVERTDIHHERRKDMADEMNKSTPVEEEIEIITLTDENGEDMDFEFLDQIESATQFFSRQSRTWKAKRKTRMRKF